MLNLKHIFKLILFFLVLILFLFIPNKSILALNSETNGNISFEENHNEYNATPNEVNRLQRISNYIIEYVSNKLGYSIKAQGVGISSHLKLKIKSITVNDSEGEWLKLNQIKISFTWGKSFFSIPGIGITIKNAIYLRNPHPTTQAKSNSTNSNFIFPINSFSINKLFILPKIPDDYNKYYSIKGDLNWSSKEKKLEFDTDILLPEIIEINNSPRFNIKVKGSYADDVISVSNIILNDDIAGIDGSFKINLDKKSYNGNIHFNSNELNKLFKDFNGSIDSQIIFNSNESIANFKIHSNGIISYKDSEQLDIKGDINGKIIFQDQIGNLSINLQNGIKGNISFNYLNNFFNIKQIKLKDKFNNSINGNIGLSQNNNLLDGKLIIDAPNIEYYYKFFKSPIYATLQISNQEKMNQVFDLKINNSSDLKCASVFNLHSTGIFNLQNKTAEFNKLNINYGEILQIKTSGNIDLNKQLLDFHKIDAKYGTSFNIQSSGGYINFKDTLLTLNALYGNYHKIKIQSEEPITIRKEGENFIFNIPQINSNSSNIHINAHGKISEDNIIDGNIIFTIPMEFIAEIALSNEHKLTGSIKSNLTLHGNMNYPTIDGTIDISNTNYKSLNYGVEVKNISAHFIGKNNIIYTNECNFYDTKNTLHTCNGKIQLDSHNRNLNFGINVSNFFLAIPSLSLKGEIEADLKLNANLEGANLTGKIGSHSLEIRIPKHFNAGIPELNIVENNDECNKSSFDYPFIFDIKFNVKNKLFVKGRGVNAEMEGNLSIKGPNNDLQLEGKFTTIRGIYEEFDKKFHITKGELLFQGALPPSPFLTIVGTYNNPEAQVNIKLEGPLLKPEISLFSQPPLPTEEILAIILFGTNTKKISPFQAISLANSVRRLTGKGGNEDFNILGKIQEFLHIDEVNINFDELKNDSSIQIGKKLTNKVKFKIEKGSKEGTGKTIIEYDILPNTSIDAELGEEGYGGLGINWKRDF